MQASLQVRLWAGDGGPADAVPAGALAMVEDFLGASPCEPVEVGQAAARAVFSDVVQAVNAGRRLQRLVQGYSKAAHGGLGAGLLLTSSEEAVSDEEMVELRQQQALSRAQPGQMFVVGALCDKVRSIPGLQFSEIDALANGPGGKSRRVLFVLPAAVEGRSLAEDEMKTRLVESFVKPSEHDAPQAGSLVIKPISGSKGNAPAAEAPKSRAVEENGSAEPSRAPWAKPQVRWAAGAAAALAVSAAIAMGLHGRGSGKPDGPAAARVAGVPAVSAAPEPAGPASDAPAGPSDASKARTKANAAVSPKPSSPAVVPAPAAPAPAAPSEAQKKAESEAKPEVAKREPEKTPAAPPPEPKPARSSTGGASVTYSAEEIGILLSRADKDSGDGNYDRAIIEYRSILSHDPGNQRAKQGMERAIRNKNGG